MHHSNTNEKKVGIAILISGKADFGTRKIYQGKRDRLHKDEKVSFLRKQHSLICVYLTRESQNM